MFRQLGNFFSPLRMTKSAVWWQMSSTPSVPRYSGIRAPSAKVREAQIHVFGANKLFFLCSPTIKELKSNQSSQNECLLIAIDMNSRTLNT